MPSMIRTARGNVIDFDLLATNANKAKPASAIRKSKRPSGDEPAVRIKGFVPAPVAEKNKGKSVNHARIEPEPEKSLADHTKISVKAKSAQKKKAKPKKELPPQEENDEVLGEVPE